MPVANNLFTGAILAPLITFLAAISLATVQRGIDWVSSIAKNPQKGFLRQIRPYAKYTDVLIERLLGGSKFTINTTNILLMAVIILLICLILEGSSNDKTKRVVVVGKKNSNDHDDKKNE